MALVMAPSADAVWQSVSVIIDSSGTLEKAPKTDAEWAAVRGHLIQVIESANLIQMPGRPMAAPGARPAFPGVELGFDEIDRMIKADPDAWYAGAAALHDAATTALKVVDARDAEGLRDAGEKMYGACESCHLKYWYPPRPMRTTPQ